jgi:hypothetical protein
MQPARYLSSRNPTLGSVDYVHADEAYYLRSYNMRPTNDEFDQFLADVAQLGNDADDIETHEGECVCPMCIAARIDDLAEDHRDLRADVNHVLAKLDQITERLASN